MFVGRLELILVKPIVLIELVLMLLWVVVVVVVLIVDFLSFSLLFFFLRLFKEIKKKKINKHCSKELKRLFLFFI